MKTFYEYLINEVKKISKDEAKEIGNKLKIDWKKIDIEQFRMGLEVEQEHLSGKDPKTHVIKSIEDAGRVALAHLEEIGDYYSKLKNMEKKS